MLYLLNSRFRCDGGCVKRNTAIHPIAGIGMAGSPGRAAAADRRARRAEVVLLERDKVIRMEKTSRVKHLEVKSGIAWLTATPADGDILLHPGDRFELRHAWPYVIQALEPAELLLRTF